MKIKDITLSELCLQSLIRNKDKFQVIANIPYRLINKYLKRININAIQLMRYERFNLEWIFDDDELWLDFLRADFPTNVHEKYVNNRDTIIKYYKDAIKSIYYDNGANKINKDGYSSENENDDDFLIKIILKNRISDTIKRDTTTKKYKVPYRMLYLQYQEDIKLKEAKITENLRLQMQRIKEEREKKSAVIVGEQFYIDNTARRNRGYRKRQFVDRMYMAPTKRMSLQNGTNQKNKNRKPVERVAFGGMAGKRIDSRLFRTIPRGSLINNINEDDIAKRQASDKSHPMIASVSNSNTSNMAATIHLNNSFSASKIHTPIRKQRNSLEQNIFLKKKKPLSRQISSSLAKPTPILNISHDKNTTTINGEINNSTIMSNNNMIENNNLTIITGTKRKQSNIFKSSIHPNTQLPLCGTLKTDLMLNRLKDDGKNNKKNNDGSGVSPNKTYRTDTPTINRQDDNENARPNNEHSNKKKKIYSLKTYLQKKK